MDKVTQAKTAWEAIAEDDEDATLEWALEHGDTVLHAATTAYAPDRITPEVVKAAAREIVASRYSDLDAGEYALAHAWEFDTGVKRDAMRDAEAALLAAFAVLGGGGAMTALAMALENTNAE